MGTDPYSAEPHMIHAEPARYMKSATPQHKVRFSRSPQDSRKKLATRRKLLSDHAGRGDHG